MNLHPHILLTGQTRQKRARVKTGTRLLAGRYGTTGAAFCQGVQYLKMSTYCASCPGRIEPDKTGLIHRVIRLVRVPRVITHLPDFTRDMLDKRELSSGMPFRVSFYEMLAKIYPDAENFNEKQFHSSMKFVTKIIESLYSI